MSGALAIQLQFSEYMNPSNFLNGISTLRVSAE